MPSTFGRELPPGCTYADIDRAAGSDPSECECECRDCGNMADLEATVTWYAEDDWDAELIDPTHCGDCGSYDWRVVAP